MLRESCDHVVAVVLLDDVEEAATHVAYVLRHQKTKVEPHLMCIL